jgi:hypothetical protein
MIRFEELVISLGFRDAKRAGFSNAVILRRFDYWLFKAYRKSTVAVSGCPQRLHGGLFFQFLRGHPNPAM